MKNSVTKEERKVTCIIWIQTSWVSDFQHKYGKLGTPKSKEAFIKIFVVDQNNFTPADGQSNDFKEPRKSLNGLAWPDLKTCPRILWSIRTNKSRWKSSEDPHSFKMICNKLCFCQNDLQKWTANKMLKNSSNTKVI